MGNQIGGISRGHEVRPGLTGTWPDNRVCRTTFMRRRLREFS
jgi:hypothetical protein